MWSVIIVIKLGTFKNIVLRGKRRTRKEGKAEREWSLWWWLYYFKSGDLVLLCGFQSINLVSDESIWRWFWSVEDGQWWYFKGYCCWWCLFANQHGSAVITQRSQTCSRCSVHFNLFFVHLIDDGGYDNHFCYTKRKLTKGNLVKVKNEKNYKLYG